MNNETIKVSVIIPVYNTERFLRPCLDSILGQTLREIEVICVDDGSTDSSPALLQEYAAKDERIRILTKEHSNCGETRNAGIAAAKGEFLSFLDSDDFFEPDMLSEAYKTAENEGSDIVVFRIDLYDSMNDRFYPLVSAEAKDLPDHSPFAPSEIKDNFISIINSGPVNKLYRRSFLMERNILFPSLSRTEDVPFVIEAFASAGSVSMLDRCFYHYRVNSGFSLEQTKYSTPLVFIDAYRETKKRLLSLGLYETYERAFLNHFLRTICINIQKIGIPSARQAIITYFQNTGEQEFRFLTHPQDYYFSPKELLFYKECLNKNKPDAHADEEAEADPRAEHIRTSVYYWMRLDPADRPAGFDRMVQFYNEDLDQARIVYSIAQHFWRKDPDKLIRSLSGAETLKLERKEIKTIGTYFEKYRNGGIERVLSVLMKIWQDMGYRVVLITKEAETPDDYALPEGVTRVQLETTSKDPFSAAAYKTRCLSLARIIQEQHIDCMVYHTYYSEELLWDGLLCKLCQVPFIMAYHSFMKFLITNDIHFATLTKKAPLFDGVMVLNSVSAAFWKYFARNTKLVHNPLTFTLPAEPKISKRSNKILWLARMDTVHKRPYDMIYMMQELVKLCPDAELLMVGDNDDPHFLPNMQKYIDKLGLSDNIRLCGYHKDVAAFYQQASVFLMTSSHEGYPMALGEVLSYGLPVVMYGLPYLEFVKGNKGIISVDYRDTKAMAAEVAKLLQDEELRHEKAVQSSQFIYDLYHHLDIAGEWESLFQGIRYQDSNFLPDDDENLVRYIVDAFALGIQYKDEMEKKRKAQEGTVIMDKQITNEIAVLANMGAKNLISNTDFVSSNKAYTVVSGSDGSITIQGANKYLTTISKLVHLKKGSYILSGCPEGGSDSSYRCELRTTDFVPITKADFGSGTAFSVTKDGEYRYTVRIAPGYSTKGLIIKPMIRNAAIKDNTFAPYAPTNRELYEMILALQK